MVQNLDCFQELSLLPPRLSSVVAMWPNVHSLCEHYNIISVEQRYIQTAFQKFPYFLQRVLISETLLSKIWFRYAMFFNWLFHCFLLSLLHSYTFISFSQHRILLILILSFSMYKVQADCVYNDHWNSLYKIL